MKNFRDFTLTELIGMKEGIDEAYGVGDFDTYIGNDIVRMLGLAVSNKVRLERDSA